MISTACDIYSMLRERFPQQLCDTVIAESVGLAESPMRGRDIFAHAPGSRGAADYKALTEELWAGNFFS